MEDKGFESDDGTRARSFVVNSLASRAQSTAEIQAKLVVREVPLHVIDEVVDEARRLGYLNDEELAAQLARASRTRRHGRARAARELRRRRLGGPQLEAALETAYADVDEVELAAAALGSRPCRDPRECRRAVAYLVRRGFSTGIAWRAVRARGERPDPPPYSSR